MLIIVKTCRKDALMKISSKDRMYLRVSVGDAILEDVEEEAGGAHHCITFGS